MDWVFAGIGVVLVLWATVFMVRNRSDDDSGGGSSGFPGRAEGEDGERVAPTSDHVGSDGASD